MVYYQLGTLYEEKGEYKAAVQYYRAFLDRWRGDAKHLEKARERMARLKASY